MARSNMTMPPCDLDPESGFLKNSEGEEDSVGNLASLLKPCLLDVLQIPAVSAVELICFFFPLTRS